MGNPLIPRVDDFAADPIRHRADPMVAPQGLTNFLGTVRLEPDLTGLSAVTFPPISQGLAVTGKLFVDGRLFDSFGADVTHEWRPDRVVRTAELDGLRIVTTTVCVPGETAVAVDVEVATLDGEARQVSFALAVTARVQTGERRWASAESPSSANESSLDGQRLVFRAPEEDAWCVQGVDVVAAARRSGIAADVTEGFEVGIGGAGRGGEIAFGVAVPRRSAVRFGYVCTVGISREEAAAAFERVAADVPGSIAASEARWNHVLEAAFTPGNDEFSGHLPVLDIADDAVRTLYWWGALGVVWFRRDYAANVLGRSYDTLSPNYWATTTFLWDYSLSSVVHALLDPAEMRRQLLHWIDSDIHTHFGTSSLTGGPIGTWYSVNDYAMTRLVADYVRYTGDRAFLDEATSDGRPVAEHLREWALAWRRLRGDGRLADFGGIENLLECVSSYTHEVASLNAAAAWNLRTAAEIARLRGDDDALLDAEADGLAQEVLGLYRDGDGFFGARQPDGSVLPVRHCYDFNVVGTTIARDLPDTVRAEMTEFFVRELQTENWMRALSPWDPDASFSVRPDHQWNGAYPAWPADAARALGALGSTDVLLDWLPGLARTANQGPPGQAHFVTEAEEPIGGGARKAPPQLPYINDWTCSSAGAWTAMVLEAVVGIAVGVDGRVTVSGPVARLDPAAELRGLRAGGRIVDVTADGTVAERP